MVRGNAKADSTSRSTGVCGPRSEIGVIPTDSLPLKNSPVISKRCLDVVLLLTVP